MLSTIQENGLPGEEKYIFLKIILNSNLISPSPPHTHFKITRAFEYTMYIVLFVLDLKIDIALF